MFKLIRKRRPLIIYSCGMKKQPNTHHTGTSAALFLGPFVFVCLSSHSRSFSSPTLCPLLRTGGRSVWFSGRVCAERKKRQTPQQFLCIDLFSFSVSLFPAHSLFSICCRCSSEQLCGHRGPSRHSPAIFKNVCASASSHKQFVLVMCSSWAGCGWLTLSLSPDCTSHS